MEIGNAETFLCRHTYPVDLSDCEKRGLFGSDGAGYELDVVQTVIIKRQLTPAQS